MRPSSERVAHAAPGRAAAADPRPSARSTAQPSTGAEVRAAAGQAAMAAALLDPARPGPGDPRFAVHRNNVAAGLIEALGATYPAVKLLVGARFFDAAALEFLRAHPPRSPALIFWGGAFPDWIAAFPPAAGLPWLADVAHLEWARRQAHDAAEAAPIPIQALAALPEAVLPALRIALHPSLRVLRAAHPAASIWADATGAQEGRPDLSRPEIVLVVRPGAEVLAQTVSPGFAAMLDALAQGRPLGAALEAAAAHPDFDAGALIAALFALRLVVGLDPAGPPSQETS